MMSRGARLLYNVFLNTYWLAEFRFVLATQRPAGSVKHTCIVA